jgi:hypothetical protein
MEYLAERGVAALGSDGNSDTAPSVVDGVAFPVHVFAVNAMGWRAADTVAGRPECQGDISGSDMAW